jgi:hypothetical protein
MKEIIELFQNKENFSNVFKLDYLSSTFNNITEDDESIDTHDLFLKLHFLAHASLIIKIANSSPQENQFEYILFLNTNKSVYIRYRMDSSKNIAITYQPFLNEQDMKIFIPLETFSSILFGSNAENIKNDLIGLIFCYHKPTTPRQAF